MSEIIIVSNGSLESILGNTMTTVFCTEDRVRLFPDLDAGDDYYYLWENGYLYAVED